jgi:hypothetical protein
MSAGASLRNEPLSTCLGCMPSSPRRRDAAAAVGRAPGSSQAARCTAVTVQPILRAVRELVEAKSREGNPEYPFLE